MDTSAMLAENHSDFILKEFKFTSQDPQKYEILGCEEKNLEGIGSESDIGLYIFHLTEGENTHPIYIDYADESFHDSFLDHALNETGVIYSFFNGKFPRSGKNSYKLCVSTFTFDNEDSEPMFLQTAFVRCFDFALNEEEDGATSGMRKDLTFKSGCDIPSVKACKEKFNACLGQMEAELKKEEKSSFPENL